MRRRAGFTLLEVMVAVAILSLSLTAIFASEVRAIRVAHRSRTTSIATMLARCKMGEVEELVAREGLPAVEKTETDDCCEGAEMDGYTCEWTIERVVLPSPGGDSVDLGQPGGAGSPGSTAGAASGDDPMATLRSGDPVAALAAGGSLATGGFGSLILTYAFPILKPSFEEQVRRATVTIRWKEGTRDESFDVVEYLVDEKGAALQHEDETTVDLGESGASP
ncbi:MAG: type II secretion system protein [Myxococcales bacterium]|nr:type II secretion system protein [Myxococcales bacterium]